MLDVGCGEALLYSWLPTDADYTGIEVSALAVRSATARNGAIEVVHTSAEDFEPEGRHRFAGIVFNEMLYYARDPVGLLRRYETLLVQDGVIVCSIFAKPGRIRLSQRMWRLLDRRRALSNTHCAELVLAFMSTAGWSILDDRVVPMPESPLFWRVWLARPTGGNNRLPDA